MNQGAWYQIKHHFQAIVDAASTSVAYAGRPRSPAPACGHHQYAHLAEQAALVELALVCTDGHRSDALE
jgi:2-oxoglutarate dehydrogenase E1 component